MRGKQCGERLANFYMQLQKLDPSRHQTCWTSMARAKGRSRNVLTICWYQGKIKGGDIPMGSNWLGWVIFRYLAAS